MSCARIHVVRPCQLLDTAQPLKGRLVDGGGFPIVKDNETVNRVADLQAHNGTNEKSWLPGSLTEGPNQVFLIRYVYWLDLVSSAADAAPGSGSECDLFVVRRGKNSFERSRCRLKTVDNA
jgi:hypothetical protein